MTLTKLAATLITFSLLGLFTSNLNAAEKWYQIEVIIFLNSADAAKVKEKLGEGTVLPDISAGFQISAVGESSMRRGSSVAFMTLSNGLFSLSKQYNQLSAAPKYTPIIHMAWRQPVKKRAQGFKAILKGGQVVSVQGSNDNSATKNTNPANAHPAGASGISSPDSKIYEVTGQIVLSRSKFLHFSTDLIYRKRSTAGESGFELYRMKEHRKMRSRELHYIDHPMFGMLIYIKPI